MIVICLVSYCIHVAKVTKILLHSKYFDDFLQIICGKCSIFATQINNNIHLNNRDYGYRKRSAG